ncbi:hypothetical protein CBR56_25175 [Bacillus thuringiensis]|uniref:hypothetical protein n=1 Tax=Bacillus tropicus TaxID=2026188 RepID=UPI000B431E10|nr:hypothetical protein [Bacillus tropicus]MED3036022.1 hypothetical protein [Bacillus tropicus]OTX90011.1 hypothetical protein BK728_03075 [Bacillus thuringiensis serovar chanpaisis]PNK23937.1 hypothetical protein CBR56_25175 [Bacillus thuringiensis]
MARTKSEDLADWGKNKGQTKKEKPKVTGFEDVADTNVVELPQDEKTTPPNDPPVHKIESEQTPTPEGENYKKHETKHEHDKFTEQFLKQFTEKATKEDTHTRQTWLIKNETIKRLDKLAKGKKKGFKTELVNQALEMLLDRIEKK